MTAESPPPTFDSRLIGRRGIAERTTEFRFEKPPGFQFTAGQFMEVTLQSPPETDAEGNTRPFTIASPPHESELTIATRMRDTAFKRTLGSMPLGTPVTIAGSFGDLVLDPEPASAIVMLAGGIGITPFHSMVLDAAHRQLPHRISLFYSNRRPEDAAFLDELAGVAKAHPRFRMVATMTNMNESRRTWHGETGLIDAAMLAKHDGLDASKKYLIAGPPRLVSGMHALLTQAGIPEDGIHSENFDGY